MKTFTLLLMTASMLVAATAASARPAPHRHQVCSMHRHHRVCVWR